MNAATQLTFLPPAQDELQKALRVFQDSGVPHAHFNQFVRSLAVSFKSAGAGATIVAACPGSPTLDEAIFGFRKEVRRFESRNLQTPSHFEPLEIAAPSRPTRTGMEAELLDRYMHALQTVRIGHRGQPQFLDPEFGGLYHMRTAISRLVTMLRSKNPPVVIIRDIQNLRCPNNSNDEDRSAWRLIIDIARQSGVPHIMFGSISAISEMVEDPTLLGEIHLEVLRPYSISEPTELACVKGILHDYNQVMPWEEEDSLVDRTKEIDQAIAGDVDRLRRWIIRAVNCALSEEDTQGVSWRHFEQTMPLARQQVLAEEDRRNALGLLDPISNRITQAPPPRPLSQKRLVKPGNRNPTRDRVIPL